MKAETKLKELDVIQSILIAYKLAKLAVERRTSFIIFERLIISCNGI